MKRIGDFRILNHGPDHAQYFQGHGLAFTSYTDCATGGGSTPGEALEDALDQLAANGWELSTARGPDGRFIPGPAACAEAAELRASERNAHEGHEDCSECEFYWYVSIDASESKQP